MIVCDKDKLDGNRCNGAPDFIIEIVSPGNPADDYIRKLYYYKNTGVREYWIVVPRRKIVTVNYFEGNLLNIQYSFESTIILFPLPYLSWPFPVFGQVLPPMTYLIPHTPKHSIPFSIPILEHFPKKQLPKAEPLPPHELCRLCHLYISC